MPTNRPRGRRKDDQSQAATPADAASTGGTPAGEAPGGGASASEASAGDTPARDASAGGASVTEVPTGGAPADDVPTGDVPASPPSPGAAFVPVQMARQTVPRQLLSPEARQRYHLEELPQKRGPYLVELNVQYFSGLAGAAADFLALFIAESGPHPAPPAPPDPDRP